MNKIIKRIMNPFSKIYSKEESEKQLIEKVKQGDKKALGELLEIHQPFIYNIAWKMVQNPQDAEDLTQEVMLKIVSRLDQFEFRSAFRTWAYRIVVNHFLDCKKTACEDKVSNFEDIAEALDQVPNHDMSEIQQQESQDTIREMNLSCISGMLLCLTREQRMVFIIGEMLGGDHNVGSEIMQISKANFRMKLQKARRDLYSFMQNKCGLVNKENPCRCHKKVKVVFEHGILDAKNLLFNRKEYSNFINHISEDADRLIDEFDRKYAEVLRNSTFKVDFDRKLFIEDTLKDTKWQSLLDLK